MRNYEVDLDRAIEVHQRSIDQQKKYVQLIEEVIKALSTHDGKVLNRGIEKHLPEALRYYQNENYHCFSKPRTSNREYSFYLNKTKGEKVRIDIKQIKEKQKEQKEKLQEMIRSGESIADDVHIFNISLQYFRKSESKLMKISGIYEYGDYR